MADKEQPNPDYEHHAEDVAGVHAPVAREKGDPGVAGELPPLWLFAVCLVVALVGGGVLMTHARPKMDLADVRPVSLDEGPSGTPEELAIARGKKVYGSCMGCHQATGVGVPGVFPPLAGSEWVTGGTERLAMIVQHGLIGEIKVKGMTYNTPGGMVSQGALLNDQKIADVLTYIRNEWGNSGSMVTKEEIAAMKVKYADKVGQWTVAEIVEKVPDPATNLSSGEAAE